MTIPDQAHSWSGIFFPWFFTSDPDDESSRTPQASVSSRSFPSHNLLLFLPMRSIHTIDYAEARQIIERIVEKALEMRKAAVIAVADSHGELIAFARMDGAPISSIRIAANKAWTAARERKPTKEIGEKVRHPEKGHDIAYYGDPRFVGWGGGIPVWKDGEVAGAVAVSGLSSTEDIALAAHGLEWLAGHKAL
ncbi:MAG: heme-binding protein [Terriglobales bacterium]